MFINYKEGIKKTNPEIVSILTPSGDHAKNVIDVLKLKKHVIVEKTHVPKGFRWTKNS